MTHHTSVVSFGKFVDVVTRRLAQSGAKFVDIVLEFDHAQLAALGDLIEALQHAVAGLQFERALVQFDLAPACAR